MKSVQFCGTRAGLRWPMRILALTGLWTIACGSSQSSGIKDPVTSMPAADDACSITPASWLTQGVFGSAFSFDDTGTGLSWPIADMTIGLYDVNPLASMPQPAPKMTTLTEASGRFTLPLMPGTYSVCAIANGAAHACGTAQFDPGIQRIDFGIGPSGHWYCGVCAPCPQGFSRSPPL